MTLSNSMNWELRHIRCSTVQTKLIFFYAVDAQAIVLTCVCSPHCFIRIKSSLAFFSILKITLRYPLFVLEISAVVIKKYLNCWRFTRSYTMFFFSIFAPVDCVSFFKQSKKRLKAYRVPSPSGKWEESWHISQFSFFIYFLHFSLNHIHCFTRLPFFRFLINFYNYLLLESLLILNYI